MKIYVTRHGQTDWNLDSKLQGKADTELNSTGIKQARKTKELLSKENIDVIISSPLKRARRTAEIINEDRNIQLICEERISERDFGEFEGMKKEEFDYRGFWSYKNNYKYEQAENITDFYNRIYAFIDSIKREYAGKSVLLVTHGGVGIPIDCYFNGIPENDDLLALVLDNCGIAKYEV